MKKFIFSAIAAIGLLLSPSCSDENEALSGSGNEALVSFSVNLADGMSTKAISDGTTAKKLQVDVYEISGETYTKLENLTAHEDFDAEKKATVNMTLVKGKEYGFVFWAQSPEASIYSVGNQTISVSYTNPLCNEEKYDAFFATDQFVAKQSFNREVVLRRPLAQLNYLVSGSDLTAAARQGMDLSELQTSIQISDAATLLNPFTNTVSGGGSTVRFAEAKPQDLSSSNTSKQYVELPKIDGTLDENGQPAKEKFYYLATTYFLVKAGDETKDSGKNSQAVVDTKLTINGLQADDYALSVQNVPVQWNHRTNIYGNLLTASGQFVVKINPLFEDEDINLPNVETVSSVNEMLTALENGSTTIKAAADFVVPEDGVIPLPKNSDQNNTEEVSFDFSAITNNSTLTFKETDGDNLATAANVSIIANGNVVINLPQSSVTLNGEYYNQVEATTAPNSLYIERGVTVNTLIAKEGNVHIKGTINTFTKDEGYEGTIYYYISTAEQLKEFAGVVNGTVSDGLLKSIYSENPVILLDEDIDLRNEEWTPIGPNADASNKFQGTFDGQGHTIRNLKVNQGQGYHAAGLFGSLAGTAKNFTIDGAEISNLSTGVQTTNGTAVVAGSLYSAAEGFNGTIENVTVKNVKVSANRYVAGIAGYVYGSIKNCHVENAELISTPDNQSGSYDNGDKAGGIAGYLAGNSSSVTDCSVSQVTIQAYRDLAGIVGCATKSTIVKNNTVNNVSLIQDNTILCERDVDTFEGIVGRKEGDPLPTIENNTVSIVLVKVLSCQKSKNLNKALSLDAKTIEVEVANELIWNLNEAYTNYGGNNIESITITGKGETAPTLNMKGDDVQYVHSKGVLILKNLHIQSNTKENWENYLSFFCDTKMEDVTIQESIILQPATHELKNVTITGTSNAYTTWIMAGANVTMENCKVNGDTTGEGRCIKITDMYICTDHGNGQTAPASLAKTTLSVSGTIFKSQKKAAVLVASCGGADITWGANNIENVAADTTHPVWVDENYSSSDAKVTVTGGSKIVEGSTN